MILFTILLLTVVVTAIIIAVTAGVLGTATIIVFGDVIVCALIVGLIIRFLIKRGK